MLIKAYSIYDRKALRYHLPFFAQTDGEAIRSCTDLVQDNSTSVARHPNDYVLFHVGDFSDHNGSIEKEHPVRHVIDLSALVPHQSELQLTTLAADGSQVTKSFNGKAF